MAFIRRRSKGSTYYYELVESVRAGENVLQKTLKKR